MRGALDSLHADVRMKRRQRGNRAASYSLIKVTGDLHRAFLRITLGN